MFSHQIEKRAERQDDDKNVFKYRYGSYMIYEANNQTKQFKVAVLMNATSHDVAAMFPEYMYQAILKTASGNPDLKISSKIVPFIIDPLKQRDEVEEANTIFVSFIISVAFSLIPASIVSRLVAERESGIYHLQFINGLNKTAYFISFFLFDLVWSFIPSLIAVKLFPLYGLYWENSRFTFYFYSLAIIPFTYVWSLVFEKESTAQIFTIYCHMALSGIAGMVVFALRMVPPTAVVGDFLVTVFRLICPTFNLSNTIIYSGL